ncbi:hypothetical protein HY967_04490 [Candidatus Jorgensenbacteria bacterium]|nr:hypothetical protein [Candidatus Jorgensenbacteria bacterium]
MKKVGFLIFLGVCVLAWVFFRHGFPEFALWTLFVFGTFWFWTLAVIATIIIIACIDHNENFTGATASLVIALLLLQFLGDVKVFSYVLEQPFMGLIYFVMYLGAGTAWSIIKWWRFVGKRKSEYDRAKAEFLTRHKVEGNAIPNVLKSEWRDRCRHESYAEAPQARQHKGKIVGWMCYWPWSLFWTLLDDPIKKILQTIYQWLQGIYQAISIRAYRDVAEDFAVPVEPPNEEKSKNRN